MNQRDWPELLSNEEIEQRISKRVNTLNEHIMTSQDPIEAYELTLRVSELQRVLYLFQDFSEEGNG